MMDLYRERKRQFDYEFERFDKGLFAFVFDAGDRTQHMFWRSLDREHPNYSESFAREFSHVIPNMYRQMDDVLGDVLARIDDKTTLLVVSDHGFTTFRHAVGLNSWLVENGYMTLLPTANGLGRELFADVDWKKTRAYALGFCSLYLNLEGREKHGVVPPGQEADALAVELVSKLREFRDPDNGNQVIRNVYLGKEVYRGTQTGHAPDLIIGFNEGYRAEDQNVLGAATGKVIVNNNGMWSGDHLMDPQVVPGVVMTNRKLRLDRPRGIDIAATVLSSLGIDRPDNMDGESLF
jgi:predicted AlkP superfamily phosphohydrolase/phosphomutase